MGYTVDSNIKPAIRDREIELLKSGFSYTEIANITGARAKSISERNRLVYKIDIWEAFRRRIETNNIPNRLSVADNFGNWFAGFFDGEGTFVVYTRPCTSNSRYSEFRLAVRIMLRDDDADVITRIKDNLQVGHVSRNGKRGNTNPTIAWVCERIEDLAEVIVPLFNNYPLYSKKAQEFAVWKPLVIQRYIDTLGGYSNRRSMPDNHRAAFHNAIEAIRKIREYPSA